MSLIVLIWIGIAVLWSVRLAYRRQAIHTDDAMRLILTIAGWVLIFVGVMGTATQVLMFLAPIAWIIILDTIFMAVGRYRNDERSALVWCLSAAAERGIPLDAAARAFAMERSDELGLRVARLGELLAGGTPLSLAMAETGSRLPRDVQLAFRVGLETNDLGLAMSCIAKTDDESEMLLRSIFEKLFYLAFVVLVLVGILTFLMLKIVPVFAKMFEEFELDLPQLTRFCIFVSDMTVSYWFLATPVLLPVLLIPLAGRVMRYFGASPGDIPFLSLFARRADAALVMRALAVAVRQQTPMGHMIWLLAERFPRWSVRNRLKRAGIAVNNGEHWCVALQNAWILRKSDMAVLMAAERSGNLEWALQEMAESNLRQLAYRMKLFVNLAFPLVLFVAGMIIAMFVIGLFMPLVSLIQGLS